ncbi:MAG: aminoglycoside phosphotransferase family protein [Bryobacteraceae bacterium]|nr:aminoglycoside phosphotransferase family protein [Bryobacteraceae bacterium]
MLELNTSNALSYLAARGYRPSKIVPLGGGVSNTVLLVETDSERFVLKQSLAKLRVEADWFSDRERIFGECAAIRELSACLPAGAVPRVLFEDRENFAFAMTAAPEGAQPWKSLLMSGAVRAETASRIASYQAALILRSLNEPDWARAHDGWNVFDQLRIDPYYRFTRDRHPDLRGLFDRLMADMSSRRVALVHGDWSPKNFLVLEDEVMAIDMEVIHWGDPSFDAAFLLNHLLLKSFWRPEWAERYRAAAAAYWRALREQLGTALGWLSEATVQHLGGLLLARIDGKSPAEYIKDPALKERIRSRARRLMLNLPDGVEGMLEEWPE